jgi:CLASP N terminal
MTSVLEAPALHSVHVNHFTCSKTLGGVQVCRTACAAVGAMGDTVGRKFEPVALNLLSELFRVLVGSILIMTESADACMGRLMSDVQAPRLLARVVDAVCRDKNNRLRQYCAKYLLQVRRQAHRAVQVSAQTSSANI